MIIEAFNHNFDKKAIAPSSHSWTVHELDAGANFHTLVFFKRDNKFYPINSHFIHVDKYVHYDCGQHLRDKNCDGACIWYEPESNAEILMMVELKSKFSESELRDAFTQTIFSFLRLHMTMSLCDGYDADSQQLRLCVGCQTYDNDSESKIKNGIRLAREAGRVGFKTMILRDLLKGTPVSLAFGTLLNYFNIGLRLPESILKKPVILNLYLTRNSDDGSLSVEL